MYLLSEYYYDYYEFIKPFTVSKNKSELIDCCEKTYNKIPVMDIDAHERLAGCEKTHFYITEINEV